MEDAMLDIMYDVPYREGIKECRISDGVVLRHEAPQLQFEKEKKTA
jgi:ATP-dependent Clp protease ATP-binding subunit ClpX